MCGKLLIGNERATLTSVH